MERLSPLPANASPAASDSGSDWVDAVDATWRTTSAAPFPVRYWDGDCVAYNPLSGDTHILDIVAGEVLRVITENPVAGPALSSRVAAFLDVPDDANTAVSVGRILHRLDELGLIEPLPDC